MLSFVNEVPEKCCQLYQVYLSGDRKQGQEMDEYMRALSSNAAGKHGVAGVKAAMDLLGYYGGSPRLPLLPLGDKAKAELKAVLEDEGLL